MYLSNTLFNFLAVQSSCGIVRLKEIEDTRYDAVLFVCGRRNRLC